MSSSNWEITKNEKVSLGRFTINYDHLLIEGLESVYSYVEINNGVCILPLLNDKIITIKQYRYPLKKWEYELPAGMIDKGEKPLESAKRELKEETGYKAKDYKLLGHFYPSAGSTDEKVYLYLAKNLVKRKDKLDIAEDIEVNKFNLDQIKEMIVNNKFTHGSGIAAFSKYVFSITKSK